jgi:hypothetical protein
MSRAFLKLLGLDIEPTIVNVNTWGMLTVVPVCSSYFMGEPAVGVDCRKLFLWHIVKSR